jgi:hypothetical protein
VSSGAAQQHQERRQEPVGLGRGQDGLHAGAEGYGILAVPDVEKGLEQRGDREVRVVLLVGKCRRRHDGPAGRRARGEELVQQS